MNNSYLNRSYFNYKSLHCIYLPPVLWLKERNKKTISLNLMEIKTSMPKPEINFKFPQIYELGTFNYWNLNRLQGFIMTFNVLRI